MAFASWLPFALTLACPTSDANGRGRVVRGAAVQPPPPPAHPFRTVQRSLVAGGARAVPYQWRTAPIGGGGFVTGLALHPRVPELVYARTDVGGAYRWDPSAHAWRALVTAERMPPAIVEAPDGDWGGGVARTRAYCVESLALDPSDPARLYLALGDDPVREGWLVRSDDGGASFRVLGLRVPMGGNQRDRVVGERLAVDPRDGRVVFFGSRGRGLWRSADHGETWARVTGVPLGRRQGDTDVGVAIVRVDPAAGATPDGRSRRVWASVAGEGIFRSDDGARTWRHDHTGFAVDLEVSGGVAFAAVREAGVLRHDATGGWQDVTPNTRAAGRDRRIEDIAVDAVDPDRVAAISEGAQHLYLSTSGGRRWSRARASTLPGGRGAFRASRVPWVETSDVRRWLSVGELAFDPHVRGRLWFAEGMGVWRSDAESTLAGGPTFDNVSRGIEAVVVSGLAATGRAAIGTVWDRIGFVLPDGDDPPSTQLGLARAFSMGTSVFATSRGHVAVIASDLRFCCGDGNYSGTSADHGRTWRRFGSIRGMTNNPMQLKFGEAVFSPTDPDNLVWAPRLHRPELYASVDGGRSWQLAAVAGFANASAPYLTSKRVLAADPVHAGRFYAYSWEPGRVYVSTDRGASWLGAPGALPTGVWHGQLVAAPHAAGHLWFCTGPDHRGAREHRGLFTSSDAGAQFERLRGVDECWAIGFGRPAREGGYPTLFVYGALAGRWGVYRSSDEGVTWDFCGAYPRGLFGEVSAIAGDPAVYGRVYVGFRGQGFVRGEPDPQPRDHARSRPR